MKHIITLFILFASLNVYSQTYIITEDVIMNHDTLKYKGTEYRAVFSPNITTLELIPRDYFIDNTLTHWPKLIQESQIEKLQSEVDELKSQVKELSILLKELLESKK